MKKNFSIRPHGGGRRIRVLPAFAGDCQLIDLGIDVSPNDINNLGTIVGSRKTDAGTIGFVKRLDESIEDLPGTTVANAVNDADQITGNTLSGAFLFDGVVRDWGG
jgi:hypothetical protein